ncbi:hypothetical protein [Planifilum fulgidum]|uniref:hypothetical protein n=1 Tax=Planifilum fulgidum TaxID=201973 RepID=UPI001160109D|nr:hypothetical protein [Planifilum fulgidum]
MIRRKAPRQDVFFRSNRLTFFLLLLHSSFFAAILHAAGRAIPRRTVIPTEAANKTEDLPTGKPNTAAITR